MWLFSIESVCLKLFVSSAHTCTKQQVKGRRGRRSKQLLDDCKEKRVYCI